MKVFVSYSSKDREKVTDLVGDFQALDHVVWFDQELARAGGHSWWSNILSNLRGCDLFVFALSPQSLASEPCQREYRYAHALNKRILPILLEDVPTRTLPAELQKIQFVDYKGREARQALALAASLGKLPAPAAMPEPLPPEPEVPLSPLARLADHLSRPMLSGDDQDKIVYELENFLRDPSASADALDLLKRLTMRADLTARVADRIRSNTAMLQASVPSSEFVKTLAKTMPITPSTIIEAIGPLFNYNVQDFEFNEVGRLCQTQIDRLLEKVARKSMQQDNILSINIIIIIIAAYFGISERGYGNDQPIHLLLSNIAWAVTILYGISFPYNLYIIRALGQFKRQARSDFTKQLKRHTGFITYSKSSRIVNIQINNGPSFESRKLDPPLTDENIFEVPIPATVYTCELLNETILLSAAPTEN